MALSSVRALVFSAIIAVAMTVLAQGATAHPHIWVSVQTTVVYDNGTVTGLRQRWLFDEFYSSMAIQGLDANGDGKYDRGELAELTKVNIEGLKDFQYFTFVKLGEEAQAFNPPTDAFMELTDAAQPPGPQSDEPAKPKEETGGFWSRLTKSLTGPAEEEKPKILALEFTLPLTKPVLADAEGFNFSTQDPTFFIWFDLAKDQPIRLAEGAPAGCKADVAGAAQDAAQLQQLGEGALAEGSGVSINVGQARTVTLSCPR